MAEEKTSFFKDYSNLMMEVSELSKNETNPFFKSGYVPLKDILAEAKKVCLSNNFIFIQKPMVREDGKPILQTTLKHISGDFEFAEMPLVAKDPNDPQKIGGALTYMRRYSLTSILGIMEVDDDGNKASENQSTSTNGKTKNIINSKIAPF